ncbi:hypothetical protein L6452_37318 [Arctium lappa]|uniref:Uncharacterized protein n=1 Tax=Arctium lappa TaxID=4217 RepID=A0ACB8Y2L8_ARCLA|nr:hypothetical protein L6452_37318 [Arctium lappa]
MSSKVLEPAFHGVGQKVGIEIWRIENLQPVPLPKSDYGRFYSGDSYIVLKTTGKAGAYMYDIHFWLGKDTSQDEAGTAAIKAVELDAILGGRAVQYRELQGHESNRFLSCFKPCMMPLEGGFVSGIKTPGEEKFETRLYTCKGKRVVRLKQVPFTRSSLNHDDIFILDTENKIFQFNGANSNMQERSKALDVVQFLKDKYHKGTCKVAIVDDGKLQAEGESGEFWVMFGGYAPLGKKVATEDDIIPERTPAKLYCIAGGQLQDVGGELSKSLLHNEKCYLLYCGSEVFIWVGRATRVEDRKAAMQAAEEFIAKQDLPKSTCLTRLIQGHETNSFRSNFGSWPRSAAPPLEENRGKVAALLKQQGGLKGQTKTSPVEEEIPPLLGENGKVEVWRIDGEAKTPVSSEDIGKFYSGDCYICHYPYHSNEKKDHYLCCWIGKDSVQEDQKMASQLATSMFNSLKGRAVQGRVYQGKEPPQFVAIFQPMVLLKGGLSSGYKSYIADKGLTDGTYRPDATALIEISGTSAQNNKALQVEAVAMSLNSYACFVLQSGSAVFTWYGNQSTVEQQQLAAKVVECLKSRVPVKFVKEGKESLAFWLALGGKRDYTSKKVMQEIVKEPHLLAISLNKGFKSIEEVYNYKQDDLLPEDVMILDTHAEVFVWVGQSVEPKEKQSAFDIGQKYIELAASLDGLSPNVPLYRVPEGSEPCFFTTYFSWDPAKAAVSANSFKAKAMLLFPDSMENQEKSHGTKSGGATQRASAMAALTNAFRSSSVTKTPTSPRMPTRGSQRAAAIAALSTVLTAEKDQPDSPTRRQHRRNPSSEPGSPAGPHKRYPISEPGSPAASLKSEEAANFFRNNESSEVMTEPILETNEEDSSTKQTTEDSSTSHTTEDTSTKQTTHEHEEGGCVDVQTSYSYEQLNTKSKNPITGINYKKREAYLSPEEFEAVFKMTKEAFYQLPRWKQDQNKKKVDLF